MKPSIKNVFEPEVIIKNNIIKGKKRMTFTMEDVNSFFSRTKKTKKQKEMVWEALQTAREKRLVKKNRNGKYVLLSQIQATSARRKPGKSRRLVKRLQAKKKKGGYSMTGLLAYLGLKWQARHRRKSSRRSNKRRRTRRRARY